MSGRRAIGYTRRGALVAVAAGGVAALGTRLAGAPAVMAQRSSIGGGGGIAGGGVAETAAGEVEFSLFATSLELEGVEGGVVFGRVQWTDPNWRGQGLTLESIEVTSYGPPADDETARELRGLMMANGEGSYPFVLRAIDVGPPGLDQDTIRLVVGADVIAGPPAAATPTDDFAYTAEATITGGDLQLLSFDAPNQG